MFLYVECGGLAIVVVAAMLYFPEQPQTAPSVSATISRESFKDGALAIIKLASKSSRMQSSTFCLKCTKENSSEHVVLKLTCSQAFDSACALTYNKLIKNKHLHNK